MKAVIAFACLWVLAFAVLLNPIGARAEDKAVGAVTAMEGDATVLRPGQDRALPLAVGQRVAVKDILTTKSNSKVEITFDDGSVIRMAPGTRLEITEYIIEDGSRQSSVVRLMRGKIRAVVSKTRGLMNVFFPQAKRFEVQTPLAVAGVRGTDFFVFHMMGYSGVAVVNGVVDTWNTAMPEDVVRVKAGLATIIREGRKPASARPIAEVVLARHVVDTTIGQRRGDEEDLPGPLINDLNDMGGIDDGSGGSDTDAPEFEGDLPPRSDEETKPPITETELPLIPLPDNDLPIGKRP